MPGKITQKKLSGEIDSSGNLTVFSDVVRGDILNVKINYPSNSVAVDVTTDEPVAQKFISLGAASTDVSIYPRTPLQDNTDTDITYDGTNKVHGRYSVFGRLKLSCSSGTSGDTVTAYVLVEEY